MGRIDAPCSLKLTAPSRGLSCNHTLLQALAPLSAAGPAGKSDAIPHRDTSADTACRCCKRGRRVLSLAPLRRGAVGRCWETTAAGAAATLRALREGSVVRAARVFGALVVEAC